MRARESQQQSCKLAGSIPEDSGRTGSGIHRQIGYLVLHVLDLQVSMALGGRHPGVAQQFPHRL